MTSTTAQPVSETQLHLTAKDACETTLSSATSYQHSQTEAWNSSIINKILTSLISSSNTTSSASEPTPSQKQQYKFAVNSTIIQHLGNSSPTGRTASTGTSTGHQTASPPRTPGEGGANGVSSDGGAVAPSKERRGMHSATGAYWNNDTDGMYSYKYEGGDSKGMDVVISVLWIAV